MAAPTKSPTTTYTNLPSCAQSPGSWYCFGEGETYGETYNGYVEHGNDLDTPFHTPITSLLSGVVTDASYQPWGGQVGIKTSSGDVAYYQHLDDISSAITVGSVISPGEFLGLSGGQTSGGDHPTDPTYSTGPHTEFGFNAPWVAGTTKTGFNSQPFIDAADAGQITYQGAGGPPGCVGIDCVGQNITAGALPAVASTAGALSAIGNFFQGFSDPNNQIKWGLIIVGALVFIVMVGKMAS